MKLSFAIALLRLAATAAAGLRALTADEPQDMCLALDQLEDKTLYGLCKAFCIAKDCGINPGGKPCGPTGDDANVSSNMRNFPFSLNLFTETPCEVLLNNYLDRSGGMEPPCNPIDDCANNECVDGRGSCVDLFGRYICNCDDGYSGDFCQVADCPDTDPCLPGGSCVPGTDAYTCECYDGYSGDLCQEDNCPDPDPCLNDGYCVPGVGTYTCNCPCGTEGKRCELISCPYKNPCNTGICHPGPDRFTCECGGGYSGDLCEVPPPPIDICLHDPPGPQDLIGGTCANFHNDIFADGFQSRCGQTPFSAAFSDTLGQVPAIIELEVHAANFVGVYFPPFFYGHTPTGS